MTQLMVQRLKRPAFATIATIAALAALTADAAARQRAPSETTAPREAGEPIMAFVSIKSQNITC
jgi:hypothetical protein